MEYVEGVTLRRIASMCRRHGAPVPLDVIAEIGRQVCDGLAHAHSSVSEEGNALNLVHRDIKPGNILVSVDGIVKVGDFGLASLSSANDDVSLTGRRAGGDICQCKCLVTVIYQC